MAARQQHIQTQEKKRENWMKYTHADTSMVTNLTYRSSNSSRPYTWMKLGASGMYKCLDLLPQLFFINNKKNTQINALILDQSRKQIITHIDISQKCICCVCVSLCVLFIFGSKPLVSEDIKRPLWFSSWLHTTHFWGWTSLSYFTFRGYFLPSERAA